MKFPSRKSFLLLSNLIYLSGCASYHNSAQKYVNYGIEQSKYAEIREEASRHSLYEIIPRHREQIEWYDVPHWTAWALLGNEDDGIFGEARRTPYSKNITSKTFCSWNTRNPLHNFNFYFIGTAQETNHSHFSLINLERGSSHVFSPQKPSLSQKKGLYFNISLADFLPFLSWNVPVGKTRDFDGYLGWRPDGAFGIKFRPAKKKN